MNHTTLANLLQAFTPLLLALITAASAWAASQIRARTRDARISAAFETLSRGAEGVVADISQNLVKALKDPNKPGTWDEVAKQAAKNAANARLRALFPDDIAVLEASRPSSLDDLLSILIERSVVALKRSTATPPALPSTSTPPPAPDSN